MSWSGILETQPWEDRLDVSGGRLSKVSRQGLSSRVREPAVAAVVPAQQSMKLAK